MFTILKVREEIKLIEERKMKNIANSIIDFTAKTDEITKLAQIMSSNAKKESKHYTVYTFSDGSALKVSSYGNIKMGE